MFEHNVPLGPLTTLKVGGTAELFANVISEPELIDVVQEAKKQQLPIRVLGGGSNVLVPDNGLSGLTIKNSIAGWHEEPYDTSVLVKMGAGEVFDRAVAYAVSKEYWGIENLSHIPGSVGATPIQNVGAYGVEIGELVEEVRALNTETGEIETLSKEDCQFGYRDSMFKRPAGKKYIVTSVTCKLSTLANPVLSYKDLNDRFEDSSPSIAEVRSAVIDIRARKFPDWKVVGTAGSFFKNPIVRRVTYEKLRTEYPGLPGFDVDDNDVKIPLGWILEHICGLRGVEEGKVGTYEGQALVLVAKAGATAQEIEAFAERIVDTVFERTGIKVEWEVTKLG